MITLLNNNFFIINAKWSYDYLASSLFIGNVARRHFFLAFYNKIMYKYVELMVIDYAQKACANGDKYD